MEKMKRYRCPQRHVVGFIRWDGHGASRLLYLRESLDERSPQPAEPVVVAIIDSGDVTCSICNASLVWMPSAPALERLLRRHKQMLSLQRQLEAGQARENKSALDEKG
jgi:hypothetical protein